MRALFDGIPLGEMNTPMTINATAAWLLALYAAVATERDAAPTALAGTGHAVHTCLCKVCVGPQRCSPRGSSCCRGQAG